MLPVFASAREKARQTTCASNEKQLALGLIQYTIDYDDYMPSGVLWTGSFMLGWEGPIYPYIKSTAVFQCPDDPTTVAKGDNLYVDSYGLNGNLMSDRNSTTREINISKLQAAAVTVAFFEVRGVGAALANPFEGNAPWPGGWAAVGDDLSWNDTATYPNGVAQNHRGLYGNYAVSAWTTIGANTGTYATGYLANVIYPNPDPTTSNGSPEYDANTPAHSGGANYAMMDGHVKWLVPTQVSAGGTAINPTDAQFATDCTDRAAVDVAPCAAGTSNLTGPNSATFAVTFSTN